MQQLNDDMDELFREAANQYPLTTEGQNWDAIMNRLQQNANPGNTHKPRSRWLWSLLLLPLLFVAHLSIQNNSNEDHIKANKTTSATVPVTENEKSAALPAVPGNNNSNIALPQKPGTTAALPENTRFNRETQHQQTFQSNRSSGKQDTLHTTSNSNLFPAVARNNTTTLQQNKHNDIKTYDKNQDKQTANFNQEDSLTTTTASSDDTSAKAALKEEITAISNEAAPETPALYKQDALKKKDKAGNSKWYIGFIASPDLSVVKWQKTAKTGYGLGILVGYSLSKRLSLETGLLWDRKYYYSKGEYLDSKKVPASWNIQDIDGWCRMFEIPLQARYKFSIRQKHNWYVNAGLSSYIMNRENYNYSYDSYGTIRKGNSVYDNETRNWFSIIHIGAGYERQLGIGNIRIEPYIKLPAAGLGWGGLPITSFGLNIGITKALGR